MDWFRFLIAELGGQWTDPELVVGGFSAGINGLYAVRSFRLQPMGYGTTVNGTNRILPKKLKQKLAMEEAMSNPRIGGPINRIKMNDGRWPSSKG